MRKRVKWMLFRLLHTRQVTQFVMFLAQKARDVHESGYPAWIRTKNNALTASEDASS
jgi:hypothetical protein